MIGPNSGANVSSFSSPASSRRSSARASGFSRNAFLTSSRSMPSASQKARNESHTLVVSTPP